MVFGVALLCFFAAAFVRFWSRVQGLRVRVWGFRILWVLGRRMFLNKPQWRLRVSVDDSLLLCEKCGRARLFGVLALPGPQRTYLF